MLFSLKELESWLRMTIFEFSIAILSVFAFTILLALKIEGVLKTSWWTVFAPLYACDTMVAYFDLIVFVHLYKANEKSLAVKRIIVNTTILLLLLIFKVLLCQQLEGEKQLKYATIHSPLFIFMFVLLVRSCIQGSQGS